MGEVTREERGLLVGGYIVQRFMVSTMGTMDVSQIAKAYEARLSRADALLERARTARTNSEHLELVADITAYLEETK